MERHRRCGAASSAVASPAVALALASVTSIYIAWDAERHQRERQRAAAAVAAAHARSEAEARIFAALARVGQEMIAVVETPVILDRLCRLTSEVLGCDRSHTWLWKPEEDAFVPVAGFGELPGYAALDAGRRRCRAFRSAACSRASSARRSCSRVATASCRPRTPPRRASTARSAGATQVIGIHTAGYYTRTEPFTEEEQRIMRGITQIASLALANARLVEQLEQREPAQVGVRVDHVARAAHAAERDHRLRGHAGAIAPSMPRSDGSARRRLATAGRELLELIESTLDIGRIEAGRDEVRIEAVALRALLAEPRRRSAPTSRAPASVTLDWSGDVPDVQLMTDPRKLTTIVRNLVANALKFTERGWVRAELAAARRTSLTLRVADTGVGIRADDQQAHLRDVPAGGRLGLAPPRRRRPRPAHRAAASSSSSAARSTVESAPVTASVFTVDAAAAAGDGRSGRVAGVARALAGEIERRRLAAAPDHC